VKRLEYRRDVCDLIHIVEETGCEIVKSDFFLPFTSNAPSCLCYLIILFMVN